MREFEFELSTKIYFGTNIINEALQKESRRLAGRVLIVTSGRSLNSYGYLPELVSRIKRLSDNDKVIVYDKITQNPKINEVKEAIELGKKENIQTVVGFGGGSAVDAAKAAALGIGSEEDIETYLLEGKEPEGYVLPIIAIPTTAGTGSELSKGAIISSPAHRIKTGIRGKRLLPCVAIVDAAYTWTVPARMAVKANVFSEMLSEHAIRIVGENLSKLADNLEDRDAREKMSFASMIMGMNLANVGTCLPHRMQYVTGACTDSSHAAGLAALYPSWIGHEFGVNETKVNQVLQWLGYPSVKESGEARKIFEELLADWRLSYSLSEYGIEEVMTDKLAGQVTGNLANDRLSGQSGIIYRILRESI